ncbi:MULTISPECIES: GntR family transcriptional regulator [unclassified Streptomyces]|uniref:GntR family transcriptional regulator n=1 Tax=unclassified Streptomyces TaxID=2593676 RepID=UPI00039FC870|nr:MULTISPECIES: GntR family transcriptional regulator [unclassified Streptomyces]MYT29519.1 FCD domain-containing protein [Streptomyces sp. SID8354]
MRGHISAHAVCTAIRDDIVSGALAPGSRLIEDILAARYGVSRVPVREALRTLQSEGFVTTRHHAGACVAELTEQEAADLLDLRTLVEPLGAARAAARRTSAHLKVLRGLVRLGRERSRHGHPADLCQLDGWFHETLAQAAGSPSLTALLTQLRRKIEWMYVMEPPSRVTASWDEHGAVLDAVARGDAERARALMTAHIERSLPVYRLRRAAPAVRDPKRPVNTARARA